MSSEHNYNDEVDISEDPIQQCKNAGEITLQLTQNVADKREYDYLDKKISEQTYQQRQFIFMASIGLSILYVILFFVMTCCCDKFWQVVEKAPYVIFTASILLMLPFLTLWCMVRAVYKTNSDRTEEQLHPLMEAIS